MDNLNIDVSQYTKPIQIHGVEPAQSLSELLQRYPLVVLVFLRQLGCTFCKTMVLNLKKLKETDPSFPPIIFVHQGSIEQGNAFFDQFWKGQIHISNTDLSLFHFFKIKVGKVKDRIGLRTFFKGIKSLLTHGFKVWQTKRIGDDKLLSGTFLFQKGKLVWAHRAKFAGDEPNWKLLH
ncbi:MAG: hypothetical protein NZ455_14420 [Bacteroidia bacterium]|nr:hypothetical protein [Bacteroidia bacterium]MDW8347582.1 hypothetical protein [Bacteroidia bacterium]